VALASAARRSTPDAHGIAEGALFADLTILIVLVGLYVPYAGPAMAAISPVPLLLLAIRRGWRVTTEAVLVACLLVGFLTGPFSALPVLTVAFRAVALGIGLRKGWQARRTVLVGTTFLWAVVWLGVTAAALLFPSWRTSTEQGLRLTYQEVAELLGLGFALLHQQQLWQPLHASLNDLSSWVLAHWLELLPLVAWPVLLVAVGAEYIIAEVVLPRFGVTPAPLSIFGLQATPRPAAPRRTGLRARVRARLDAELLVRQEQLRERRAARRPRGKPVAALETVSSRSEGTALGQRRSGAQEGTSGD